MRPLCLPLAAPLLALALCAAPAAAQIGNQSDITGIIVTGGSLMGFVPGRGLGNGHQAALIESKGTVRYGTARVACAVAAVADSTVAMLRAGTLPSAPPRTAPLTGDAQRDLAGLVRPADGLHGNVDAFAAALARHADGSPSTPAETEAATALARALDGLMTGGGSCGTAPDPVPAAQLAAAFAAYSDLVGGASAALLSAPSPELLATQALLERLARAALAAAR
jgi:hypothetical protein